MSAAFTGLRAFGLTARALQTAFTDRPHTCLQICWVSITTMPGQIRFRNIDSRPLYHPSLPMCAVCCPSVGPTQLQLCYLYIIFFQQLQLDRGPIQEGEPASVVYRLVSRFVTERCIQCVSVLCHREA